MASITASNFISKTSQTNYGGAFDLAPRTYQNRRIPQLRNQTAAYNGLRSQNMVDLVQLQANAKETPRQPKRGPNHENHRPWGKIVCGSGMNVIFVGAEVAPWSKTGGLGDVLGGLPPAMAANGHRVMTVSPRYDQYKDAWDTEVLFELQVGKLTETVRLFHCYRRGVDRVFVDHPVFLEKVWGKTGGKIYGPLTGNDYQENQLRFSILCMFKEQHHFEHHKELEQQQHQCHDHQYFGGLQGLGAAPTSLPGLLAFGELQGVGAATTALPRASALEDHKELEQQQHQYQGHHYFNDYKQQENKYQDMPIPPVRGATPIPDQANQCMHKERQLLGYTVST